MKYRLLKGIVLLFAILTLYPSVSYAQMHIYHSHTVYMYTDGPDSHISNDLLLKIGQQNHIRYCMRKDSYKSNEEPYPYIKLSESEVHMLATLVYLEAGVETEECMRGVASVVINRMIIYDMSLRDVIYQPHQFSPAHKIPYTEPSQKCIDAAKYVVMNGPTLPKYITYFRAGYFFKWATPYKKIDRTYFSYDQKIKDKVTGQ